MNKAYSRINNGKGWENHPSDKTALNEQNLNHMEIGIDEIDNRVITLDNTKATKIEVSPLFKEVAYDERTGIITFTRKNGATVTIDTPMEKIALNIYYDPVTEMLALPLIDGTQMQVDLSRLITEYEFLDSDTIAFSVGVDGKVSAIVKEGSIQEKHLRPDYLANIRSEVSKAQTASRNAAAAATEAGSNATLSKSWAVGDTGTRPGENTDNSKYYYQQSKSIYDNFSQAGTVTGVKGNAETTYRTGNVNLTAANVGAVNKGGDTIPGRLKFINSADLRFITPDVTTGDHARGMSFIDKSDTKIWGGIGVLGRAGEPQYIYIGAGTPHPWEPSNGLCISDTYIKWKNSNLVTENSGTAKEATKATQDGNGNVITSTYLPLSGGTITGNLRLKGSGNYGNTINFGDRDFVHISEPTDDHLEIKGSGINFVTAYERNEKFTLNGKKIALAESIPNIQHGTRTISLAANTLTEFSISFEKSFSSIPNVVFTPRHNSASGTDMHKLKTITTSGFTGQMIVSGGGTYAIEWIAIGS